MLTENHKDITREALKCMGIKWRTLEFIAGANADSDVSGRREGGSPVVPQHFQNPTWNDNDVSFRAAWNFYEDALGHAAIIIVQEGRESFTKALYFFGRALHCLQDFYAHTNYIFMDPYGTVFDPAIPPPPDLYLSYPTPVGSGFLDSLGSGYLNFISSPMKNMNEQYQISSQADLADWLLRIRSQSVFHPDIHLDWSKSWASRAYRALFHGPHHGYGKARELAVIHTRDIAWPAFANIVGLRAIRSLRQYDVPWTTPNWKELRREFNLIMSIQQYF